MLMKLTPGISLRWIGKLQRAKRLFHSYIILSSIVSKMKKPVATFLMATIYQSPNLLIHHQIFN